MNSDHTWRHVERVWDEEILPPLTEYVTIPARSPHFDAEWQSNGHLDRSAELIADWCRRRPVEGLQVEILRLEGRTPLIFAEVAGEGEGTVLFYGHFDKQPEMVGWREGFGAWEPVIEDGRLYGRGGADDGYAPFASLLAIEALQAQGVPHGRCVMLIEGCEESGSYDLPPYIDHLADRIGDVDLVVALDSGAGDYERLWLTCSLRGFVMGNLEVSTVSEGVHSGSASGIVPSSFRVARMLLDRVEDASTGRVLLGEMNVEIPADRQEEAATEAEILGGDVASQLPFVSGARPWEEDATQLLLNRTWRPALSVVGASGLPEPADAGNVLRPLTVLKLSMRVPPTCDADAALDSFEKTLTEDAPFGAQVAFTHGECAAGWNAPPLEPWLRDALQESSQRFFGAGVAMTGEGGTIPLMGLLTQKFPRAQFVVTGVLGPGSNAHGPNEFLDIPSAKRLTACVAEVLARRASR